MKFIIDKRNCKYIFTLCSNFFNAPAKYGHGSVTSVHHIKSFLEFYKATIKAFTTQTNFLYQNFKNDKAINGASMKQTVKVITFQMTLLHQDVLAKPASSSCPFSFCYAHALNFACCVHSRNFTLSRTYDYLKLFYTIYISLFMQKLNIVLY